MFLANAEVVFINVLLFQSAGSRSGDGSVKILHLPYIRVDKGIELGIIIHTCPILVKFNRIIFMILNKNDQTVVIVRKIFKAIQAMAVYGVKFISNARLDKVGIGIFR